MIGNCVANQLFEKPRKQIFDAAAPALRVTTRFKLWNIWLSLLVHDIQDRVLEQVR